MAENQEQTPEASAPPASAVRDKHERLRIYIHHSSALRKKFIGPRTPGATYIDPYCSPLKSKASSAGRITEASAVVAFNAATANDTPFSALHVADTDTQALLDTERALKDLGAPVRAYRGDAPRTIPVLISSLNKSALHFGFVDAPDPESVPFEVLTQLTGLPRLDLMIYLNVQELQRNLGAYLNSETCPLDAFAPGWREVVEESSPLHNIRDQVLEHWLGLIRALEMDLVFGEEIFAGQKNQSLHWLVFAGRHPLIADYWERIRNPSGQSSLDLS
jgi:three-Cys-motif partner protein